MSTENETNENSLPTVLHFVKDSTKTAIRNDEIKQPSNDESGTEATTDQVNNAEQKSENNDHEKPITTVSHSRRVHFPIDESQLCMLSYNSDPFSKQPLLSLGVILQRYRATCQRLQIRPSNVLLDQLSKMDDGRTAFIDRLDCLKIVNEKIDLKHIDAIEEILSRCRFHTLDLDSSSIDDSALTQLFDVIEYYESCTHLNLSNNRSIGVQGYQALSKYLRRTNSLERLDMNSIRFDENAILSFTRSLRLSSTLYELHVESCQLNGKILQKFIQNIRSCSSLRELYLCDNRLQVQDSLLINELIRTCGPFLLLLDLRSNSLHDTGMSHLASQLSHYDENHKHENSLQKISVQANHLTQQGVGFLAKSLLHNRTVRSLNLSQNNITNEGLFLLRDALLTNRTISELILRNCHLTDQAAIALAEFIAESSTIQYVDLRENNIQASGVCGMAIAIKNNKSLLKLDFDPIASTPTNLSALSASNSNNNIDRTTNTSSLLSLSSLRRMTTGFSSFTSNTPFQSTAGGGGGTRELLEQKARWMNDIAAVCQRNILIYEENLRRQEEEQHRETTVSIVPGTNEQDSTVIKPEDVKLKEQTVNRNESHDGTSLDETNNESTTLSTQNNSEDDARSTNTHETEPLKDDSLDDQNKGIEQSLDILTDGDSNLDEQVMSTSTSNEYEAMQPVISPHDHNDDVQPSADGLTNSDSNVEQTTITPDNNNHQVEPSLIDSVEPVRNGDNDESNQNSTSHESPLHLDSIDDIADDNKRKLHHSDSLYLLRKKVNNANDNDTSDDESQFSSSEQ